MFTTCAQGLEKKIEGYRAIESTNSDDDPHDLEMKTLLLDALSKKIQQERPITIPTMRNSPPLPDDNPLVLHSSGVLSEKTINHSTFLQTWSSDRRGYWDCPGWDVPIFYPGGSASSSWVVECFQTR